MNHCPQFLTTHTFILYLPEVPSPSTLIFFNYRSISCPHSLSIIVFEYCFPQVQFHQTTTFFNHHFHNVHSQQDQGVRQANRPKNQTSSRDGQIHGDSDHSLSRRRSVDLYDAATQRGHTGPVNPVTRLVRGKLPGPESLTTPFLTRIRVLSSLTRLFKLRSPTNLYLIVEVMRRAFCFITSRNLHNRLNLLRVEEYRAVGDSRYLINTSIGASD